MLNMDLSVSQIKKMVRLYELHIIREKLSLFEKKYGKSFKAFEKEVKEREDFERWDDYLEWKAYLKAYEDLSQEHYE